MEKENINKNMSEVFKGYSKYSDDEYKEIWREATIVLDTNILLNFYRYSSETREQLYTALKSVKDRLWIPYQVASEYFKNKANVIHESHKAFDKLLKESSDCFNNLINIIDAKATNQLKCKKELLEKISSYKDEILNIIKDEENEKKDNANEEIVEVKIFDLFNDSLGEEIVGEEFDKIKTEGIKRMKNRIPPGYMDSDKDENGDFYIFYSIMKYSKQYNKHIIFVTDDTKEDWFMSILGETKGGNYKLLNEFFQETGKLMLIYTSDGFLKALNKNLSRHEKITDETINELISTRNFRNYIINNNIIMDNEETIENLKNILAHDNLTEKDLEQKINIAIHNLNVDDTNRDELKDYLFYIKSLNNKLEKNAKIKKYIANNLFINIENIKSTMDDIKLYFSCCSESNIDDFCDTIIDKISVLISQIENCNYDNKYDLVLSQLHSLKDFISFSKTEKPNNKKFFIKFIKNEIEKIIDHIQKQM